MGKIKVGLIVNTFSTSKQVHDLIQHLKYSDNFEPVLIIIGDPPKRSGVLRRTFRGKSIFHKFYNLFTFFVQAFLLRLIKKLELLIVRKSFHEYGKKYSIEDIEMEIIYADCSWSKSGSVVRPGKSSINSIISSKIDVLVRANSGILKGDILKTTKHGILSYHLGDNRTNRGGPPGFWEVLNNEPSTGFIIQRLSAELDGGEVLFRGNIATAKYWYQNHAQIIEKSQYFMIYLLNIIYEKGSIEASEGPSLHHNPLYKLNGKASDTLSYIIKTYIPLLMDTILKIFQGPLISRWGVAYSSFSNLRTSLHRYQEIKNPRGRFLADPFVITIDKRSICFVEDYFYSDNKGRISAIELMDDSYEYLGVVLEEDFHLSYPFVFNNGSDLFMIPESSQAKQIRLYKCIEFPLKWELHKILMNDVRAADSSVIKVENVWYMLTNICSAGIGEHCSELHVYYSKDIESNEWQPLDCGNPVIFDSRYSRNGGVFKLDDMIIRINQVQGKGTYGESFRINKITQLSPQGYKEIVLDEVYPNFFPGITSTHHFHTNEDFSVIDFARPERLSVAKKT